MNDDSISNLITLTKLNMNYNVLVTNIDHLQKLTHLTHAGRNKKCNYKVKPIKIEIKNSIILQTNIIPCDEYRYMVDHYDFLKSAYAIKHSFIM